MQRFVTRVLSLAVVAAILVFGSVGVASAHGGGHHHKHHHQGHHHHHQHHHHNHGHNHGHFHHHHHKPIVIQPSYYPGYYQPSYGGYGCNW